MDPAETPIPTPPPDQPSAIAHPAPGWVVGDQTCIHCSYNLASLPRSGQCPECGHPVEDSFRGNRLAYASPVYLRSLHHGLILVLLGILVWLLLWVVRFFLIAAAGTTLRGLPTVLVLANFLPLIGSAMLLVGYWKFTTPDPGIVGTERTTTARRVIRITVVVQTVAATFSGIMFFLVTSGRGTPAGGWMVTNLDEIAATVAWAVQFFAVMAYIQWLAARVPDRAMLRRTSTYSWLLPVLCVLLFLLIGPAIALILYWNLLNRLRRRLAVIRTLAPSALPG